jgi:hypothetical protein
MKKPNPRIKLTDVPEERLGLVAEILGIGTD